MTCPRISDQQVTQLGLHCFLKRHKPSTRKWKLINKTNKRANKTQRHRNKEQTDRDQRRGKGINRGKKENMYKGPMDKDNGEGIVFASGGWIGQERATG